MLKTIPYQQTPFLHIITRFVDSHGKLITIFRNEYSGKVITREKIDTFTKVFHPGIIIGEDQSGRIWVAHNHYSNKRPLLELIEKFSENPTWFWDNRAVIHNSMDIVSRSLFEINKGRKYNSINYNCQTFVNLIVRNSHNSEAVDKITNATSAFGGILAILGLINKRKTFVTVGLGIIGVSEATKRVSRLG